MSPGELAWAGAAVLLGYGVLGLSGFGSALVAVPLLAWRWPLDMVVPLVLLIDVPASLLHAGLNLRQVAWREMRWLLPALAAGAALGTAALAWAQGRWPLMLLGLYVASVGLRGWRGLRKARPGPDARRVPAWGAVPAGLLAGVVEAWFGTSGPVLAGWLARRLPEAQALRATVPISLAAAAALVLAGAAWDGRLSNPRLWQAWALLLPLALGAVWAGHRLALRLPAAALSKAVYGLLLASGLALAFGSTSQQ